MEKGMVVDLKKKKLMKSTDDIEVEDEEDVILPGFRFHPTDEELVGFYLRRKVEKKRLSIDIIKQIDIYKYDPWDLPKTCSAGGEKEWYFFCLRGRKYRNSVRPNRVITGSGFWKATGIDRPIYDANSNDCIGLKKSLVYYRGSAGKGTKTDWMMHEFRLPSKNHDTTGSSPPSSQEAEIWTICRIFKRHLSFMKKYTQSRKQSVVPADSSSKTSSFESDAGDHEYRYGNGIPSVEPNEGYLTNYCDYQVLFGGQWNPTVQAQMPAWHPNVTPNSTATEFFIKDGNWDEIRRIMERELELDTNAANECIYY